MLQLYGAGCNGTGGHGWYGQSRQMVVCRRADGRGYWKRMGVRMKRVLRRFVLLLLAKLLRRRIVRLARRWLARRARRAGSSMGRAVLRRGARGLARGSARVLSRSPLSRVPIGEGLILRLFMLAEALDDRPTREGAA